MPGALKKSKVIGLVGGIASGKSHAAQALVAMGAELIDADEIGHQVLTKPLVARSLIQHFGPGIVDNQGAIDRAALAGLVFGTEPQATEHRQYLEAMLHPLIHAEAIRRLRALNEQKGGPPAVVVVDAPLLLEADWYPICDAILFLDTPDAVREKRALNRGWTSAQFREREDAQLPLDEKRAQATFIVDGQDDKSQQSQLKEIWSKLTK